VFLDIDLDGDLDLFSAGRIFYNELNPTAQNFLRYARNWIWEMNSRTNVDWE